MGWTKEQSSRSEVVSRHARKEEFPGGVMRQALATHQSGNENWFLFHVTNTDGIRSRYIEVMVWEDGWHKEMSEDWGPYYYGCPVHWFQQVPCPGSLAANWRTQVVAKQPNAAATAAAAHIQEWAQRIQSGKAPL